MTEVAAGTRRERLRAQTLAEIKEHALAQLAAGGPEALSLNGISRAMRMSGPALYRYFASRDELLAALVVEAYDELADALQQALSGTERGQPRQDTQADAAARFRAVADAYRAWARANPYRYQLIFSSRYGSGLHTPERTVPAAHRSMSVVVIAVAALAGPHGDAGPATPTGSPGAAELVDQIEDWADRRPDRVEVPAAVLQLGVLTWTRLHGLVSLEIGGAFTAMDIDPELLYTAEVDHLIAQTRASGDLPR